MTIAEGIVVMADNKLLDNDKELYIHRNSVILYMVRATFGMTKQLWDTPQEANIMMQLCKSCPNYTEYILVLFE